MDEYLDKETKQFLLVLGGILIYILFIYPRMMGSSIGSSFSVNGLIPASASTSSTSAATVTNIDKNKNYFAVINTSAGPITIDLLEKSAPKNVGSFAGQVNRYSGANIMVQKGFLLKVDAKKDTTRALADEINPDSLGLNNTKVRDVRYFKDLYDPADSSTRYFSPENLQRYEDFTVKEFYEEILDYKYQYDVETPEAKKYMVYMTSTGPNTNKTDFFILMSDAAANVNGRYTPIGQITEGFDILDTINESASGSVTVNNVKLETR